MSEVTKLYENAGIEQTQDITCGDCEFVNYPEENKPCNACTQYGIKHHPPFTAEKQLNVLKIIVYSFGFNALDKPIWDKGWDIAIAKLVNIYWEVLSTKEKQQIKEILE